MKEIAEEMAHLKDALALDVVDVRVHRTKTRAPN
jgi:hypothetical protein